jgi:hypothetical protein
MKKLILIVLAALLFWFVYIVIYPVFLCLLAPFPENNDTRAKNYLREIQLGVQQYRDDNSGKLPQSFPDLLPFIGPDATNLATRVEIRPSLGLQTNLPIIIAFSKAPLPSAIARRSVAPFVGPIRGWPEQAVPKRRAVLLSDDTIKIIPETEFQQLLKTK